MSETNYTFNAEDSFASRMKRSYVHGDLYEQESDWKNTLEELKKQFEKKTTAYILSGKWSFFSLILLMFSGMFVIAITGALDLALVWLDEQFTLFLASMVGAENVNMLYGLEGIGWIFGVISLVSALLIVALNVILPSAATLMAARASRTRNGTIVSIFSGLESFFLSMFFFWPWIEGETLAPTDFVFIVIPISWVFIIVGAVIAPIFCAYLSYNQLSNLKFCEVGQVYLEEMYTHTFPIAWLDDVMFACTNYDFSNLHRVPRTNDTLSFGTCTFFGHEEATMGYLEVQVKIKGQYKILDMREQEKDEKSEEEWLVLSVELTMEQIRSYLQGIMSQSTPTTSS